MEINRDILEKQGEQSDIMQDQYSDDYIEDDDESNHEEKKMYESDALESQKLGSLDMGETTNLENGHIDSNASGLPETPKKLA